MRSEVDVAAEHAARLASDWGPDSSEDSLAKTLARGLHGTIPQIAGAALTAPVAYRWKTQINENAKAPAFAAELPELDHNELVGWDGARDFGPFSAVFLDDSDLHPRVRQRIELTRGLIASRGGATFRVETRSGRRACSASFRWSCWVTCCRSISRPCAVSIQAPVEAIESLKSALNGARDGRSDVSVSRGAAIRRNRVSEASLRRSMWWRRAQRRADRARLGTRLDFAASRWRLSDDTRRDRRWTSTSTRRR